MKKYLNNQLVKIIKELSIKDKEGNWVQIEFLEGESKGNRKPIPLEKLSDKINE